MSTIHTCVNCGKKLEKMGDGRLFKKLLICADCHKIVKRCMDRAEKMFEAALTLYADTLRVALIRKQVNLPRMPKEDSMPPSELAALMNIMKVMDANGKKGLSGGQS